MGVFRLSLVTLCLILNAAVLCNGGITSTFVRKAEKTIDMPLNSDVFSVPPGYNAPQQVHITQGDHEGKGVIISWVTQDEPGSNKVLYWSENSKHKFHAKGKMVTYRFYNYTPGFIHHCTINDLEFDTKYYYEVGLDHTPRRFWFRTPPRVGPDVPYTFGLIGDLGQSYDSNKTLTHYESNLAKGQTVLFVGDLSYADNYPLHDNVRWDTWARFVERSVAYQPWIWTAGNHEIDFLPEYGETIPFKPYRNRYPVPYRASGSTAPFWYSIKRASAYIIVLSSYSAYGKYTPQFKWLEQELPKVNRSETPWLIVLMHSPWYNSYNYHYMEGETMRVMYEPWFVKYKVDVVFAGHVHAYERSERVSNIAYNIVNGVCSPVNDQSAPIYITIGDGGNLEGLATNMTEPQPKYSAYREASFGHAIFDIKNRTHAYYSWHRNQDGVATAADSLWFFNRYWHPVDESTFTCYLILCVSGVFKVHITQGDHEGKGVIISWVTQDGPGSSRVLYWSENKQHKSLAKGIIVTYKFYNYTSGFIHHCTINDLEFDTKYYYEVGIRHSPRQFWFRTPPKVGPDVPYTFGLVGDLGQTFDSNQTLTHYQSNPAKGQTLLYVGDLSYADDYPLNDNARWDSWGRFVERSVAYQPWIWTAGNHEIDFLPEYGETIPFKPYSHRYHVPYTASGSTEPFWYSIKRASAYIIVLSSYSPYCKSTPQYKWLQQELPKVNRSETPWLIVLMHSPLYNSYTNHFMEGEPMRVVFEAWFVKYKVDVVIAGHVHAYERSERVSNIAYDIVNGLCTPVNDPFAPVYITIGDGGNQEGLATNMTEPQPKYSAYREASFGHGIFDIKNRTHAYFSWHRNQDGLAITADSLWFFNRYWHPVDE
ncbi:Phosphoesterase domain [Macleaya cordata]|uniref:Purple acid phosphatase n=1 Tax=Macleaya cordata TaxID=56857 RepID=A0A200QDY9_MACCD|nr:Phosphoesterase domain [Macleaya cordata]